MSNIMWVVEILAADKTMWPVLNRLMIMSIGRLGASCDEPTFLAYIFW